MAIAPAHGKNGSSGRLLGGLLVVQLIVGYEWLASGLSKLIRGDFPGGLAGDLHEKSKGAAGWYQSFLDGTVIPHAHAFGYLIELSELLAGLALIAAALAWLLAAERLPRGGRGVLLLATAGASLAGIVMAVNFHLANGGAPPWGIPGESFDEAVDLDSLIVAILLVLLVVSLRRLLALRRERRGGPARPLREPRPARPRTRRGRVDYRRERRQGRRGKEMIHVNTQPTQTKTLRKRALFALAPLTAGLALGAALLGGGASAASPSATDQIRALQAKVATLQQNATYWNQLVSIFKPAGPAPFNLRSMSDHRLYMLPSGYILALHFDNMNLAKAKNLNWIALGVPGVFTKADQARVTKEFGPGFTHFHDLVHDTHGGKPGAKGAWFLHIGVRDFTSPWGKVTAGQIDPKFMPTPPTR